MAPLNRCLLQRRLIQRNVTTPAITIPLKAVGLGTLTAWLHCPCGPRLLTRSLFALISAKPVRLEADQHPRQTGQPDLAYNARFPRHRQIRDLFQFLHSGLNNYLMLGSAPSPYRIKSRCGTSGPIRKSMISSPTSATTPKPKKRML